MPRQETDPRLVSERRAQLNGVKKPVLVVLAKRAGLQVATSTKKWEIVQKMLINEGMAKEDDP